MWFDPRNKMPVEDMDVTIRTPDGREFELLHPCLLRAISSQGRTTSYSSSGYQYR